MLHDQPPSKAVVVDSSVRRVHVAQGVREDLAGGNSNADEELRDHGPPDVQETATSPVQSSLGPGEGEGKWLVDRFAYHLRGDMGTDTATAGME